MIDTHTHTTFSFDAKSSPVDMAERGKELGLQYMAFTDHYDRDYAHIFRYRFVRQLKLDKYVEEVMKLKEKYPFLALGIECGYSRLAEKDYCNNIPFDKMDYIINSIHTIDKLDCYEQTYFRKYEKEEAFTKYLNKILESLDAKYDFDTIAHIGFVRKNCPYTDPSMKLSEYGDMIEAILKRIIEKDKTLEVNSNIKYKDFMPTREIIQLYYDLGGRNITFASDAHVTNRVAEMYSDAAELVKSIGFTHWTVYRERKPIKIEIE